MGLPQIIIEFKTSGMSAISRSSRGRVLLILKDAAFVGAKSYSALSEVTQGDFTPESYECIRLCFLGSPARVTVMAAKKNVAAFDAEDALQQAGGMEYDWLCAPALDSASVIAFVKAQRTAKRIAKAVVANDAVCDSEGIVNFCAEELVVDGGKSISASDYACRIAGVLAGLSLAQSATYYPLPELTGAKSVAEPDNAIDQGKLIIARGNGGFRLGRAVTSLTSVTADKGNEFKKIKIVEAVDLMRRDIAQAFEGQYVGKVVNDYDSKLLLVTAINGYLASITGEILDISYDNGAFVSFDMQRTYLSQSGIDVSKMSDIEILKANTGAKVFLAAKVRFADAMEDLTFGVNM